MKLLSTGDGQYTTLTVITLAVAVSLISHKFGFHPAVGAYMAGLIVKKEYLDFPKNKQKNFYDLTKLIIDNVTFCWIGPVFFVTLSTRLIFEVNILFSIAKEVIILTIGLLIG